MAAIAKAGNGLGSVTTVLVSDAVVADASGHSAEVLGQALSAVCTFTD